MLFGGFWLQPAKKAPNIAAAAHQTNHTKAPSCPKLYQPSTRHPQGKQKQYRQYPGGSTIDRQCKEAGTFVRRGAYN